ncbi:hypothetical protein NC652_036140 [Populus alba x Populus x berolinensis]|nr:hypothetical protein NC652_036140 [Populus alba x Populus x berolinensis]
MYWRQGGVLEAGAMGCAAGGGAAAGGRKWEDLWCAKGQSGQWFQWCRGKLEWGD